LLFKICLICDDADDAALALKKIIAFSVSDVNITVFNAGEDALAYIRSGKKPDLCFLDILMPEMDGMKDYFLNILFPKNLLLKGV
jgi:CheY-like chemotaxis protein